MAELIIPDSTLPSRQWKLWMKPWIFYFGLRGIPPGNSRQSVFAPKDWYELTGDFVYVGMKVGGNSMQKYSLI